MEFHLEPVVVHVVVDEGRILVVVVVDMRVEEHNNLVVG
jgi:hypothetical protein